MILPLCFTAITILLVLRFLSKTSCLDILCSFCRSFEDRFHVYQTYKVPQFNENFQENLLYRKVFAYLNSLPSLEDSQFTNLFTGSKSNDILLNLDVNQTITDTFLGARVSWKNQKSSSLESNTPNMFILRLRKKDKRRILRPYMQHILSIADQIEVNKEEIRLFMNVEDYHHQHGRWRSVPFTHPATMDTVVLDTEVKNKVKADLETFLKSKQYYQRLGRAWKRSYLLYGASGTGKSSFVAAMAKFLCYDVYDIDLSRVSDDSDLKMLLLQTRSRSLIVVEGLDRFLNDKSMAVSLSGIVNFMDGIISCCAEERLMVFTVNDWDQINDQTLMRAGRIDVQLRFPLCDFSTFKVLAHNYLGLKDHKLFVQVEEEFQNGPNLSPAQIGELMISNRASPTRALKSVITALQSGRRGDGRGENGSGQHMDKGLFCRESVHTVREFGNFYGIFRFGSRRKEESSDLAVADKEGSRHQVSKE